MLGRGGHDEECQGEQARVTHRYQEVQRRTWCSARPARDLPAAKFSSVLQRIPATRTRAASGADRGE